MIIVVTQWNHMCSHEGKNIWEQDEKCHKKVCTQVGDLIVLLQYSLKVGNISIYSVFLWRPTDIIALVLTLQWVNQPVLSHLVLSLHFIHMILSKQPLSLLPNASTKNNAVYFPKWWLILTWNSQIVMWKLQHFSGNNKPELVKCSWFPEEEHFWFAYSNDELTNLTATSI